MRLVVVVVSRLARRHTVGDSPSLRSHGVVMSRCLGCRAAAGLLFEVHGVVIVCETEQGTVVGSTCTNSNLTSTVTYDELVIIRVPPNLPLCRGGRGRTRRQGDGTRCEGTGYCQCSVRVNGRNLGTI